MIKSLIQSSVLPHRKETALNTLLPNTRWHGLIWLNPPPQICAPRNPPLKILYLYLLVSVLAVSLISQFVTFPVIFPAALSHSESHSGHGNSQLLVRPHAVDGQRAPRRFVCRCPWKKKKKKKIGLHLKQSRVLRFCCRGMMESSHRESRP